MCKIIGFIVFSLKNGEKPLVLLCFRWNMLKNNWFYCVFAQTCWKTIGLTVFSLKNVEKPLVLLCFRSTMLKNNWFYRPSNQTWWKNIGFTSKEAERYWKTTGFTVKPVRATGQPDPADGFGVWFSFTLRRSYEEPLQTSCLGNLKQKNTWENTQSVSFVGKN